MKFSERLMAHITPEWRKQYIQYEEMKALLYAAVEQAPSAEVIEPEFLTRYFTKFEEEFFQYCDKELTKINTFYSEKMAEATRKSACLKNELAKTKDDGLIKQRKLTLTKKNVSERKIQELKLAYSEFYLSLILLQNYQNLNFTGFRKILKKHDKLLAVDYGGRWQVLHVENSHFHANKDIDRMIHETEGTVTNELEGGDRQRAMKRLRVPPLGEQQSPWITFKVGFFSGAFIILLIAVILSASFHNEQKDWYIVWRLYRGPFLIVEFLFLWGINIYGWRSSGVNHVLIFELDPRDHLSEQQVMELAAIFGVIWSLSLLCFLYSSQLSIPAYINPLVLLILMMIYILNPSKTFGHKTRFWALRVLGRIFLAPFFYVTFADFWLADQLTSLATVFTDMQYFVCFYSTLDNWSVGKESAARQCAEKYMVVRPILACLPSWFRFAQCLRRYRDTKEAFPHLANAMKYATTFFVIIFTARYQVHSTTDKKTVTQNPFFYLWIIASLISSCYGYTWDVKLDWGLFDAKPGDKKFLREETVYPSTWVYYFAIVENLVLRFSWVLSMSMIEMHYIHADMMTTILPPLEVFRRFVWNFFRLENEHFNNCGKFRAVRDISVAPLDCSNQILMLRMMDEQDGAVNRHKKRDIKTSKSGLTLDGDITDEMDN